MNICGLILINKPPGMTSFQLLAPIKRKLGTRKVGHAGTLDKFAQGLMLVLVGYGTRFVQYLSGMDKSYRAELSFGAETDTLDIEGNIKLRRPLPVRDDFMKALENFRGTFDQVPPDFSAIHVNGKRAYQLARAGQKMTLSARQVKVSKLELVNYTGVQAEIIVECSKGTYVRSLARDIARSANSAAYLTALSRNTIGPFHVDEAMQLDDFLSSPLAEIKRRFIWGIKFLNLIPNVSIQTVDDNQERRIAQGKTLYVSDFSSRIGSETEIVALLNRHGDLLALVYPPRNRESAVDQDEPLKYRAVFAALDMQTEYQDTIKPLSQ